MQLRAPAKVNLSFEIRTRRPDGFHEIETLMTPISVYDQINISRVDTGGGIQLACGDASLPTGDDNLVVRAARLFCAATNRESALQIELQKVIPHGAGLCGCSSDAAAVLLGLNELFESGLPVERIAALAGELGSDVPFFVYRSAAVCRGRGELITPTALPRQLPLLLLKPAFAVPTPWAYSRWRDAAELPGISYAPQEFGNATFVNDLERPVFEKHLFLGKAKMWLLAQLEVGAAMMSGSGSTLFAVLRDAGAADLLAKRAREELDPDLWTCACETLAGW